MSVLILESIEDMIDEVRLHLWCQHLVEGVLLYDEIEVIEKGVPNVVSDVHALFQRNPQLTLFLEFDHPKQHLIEPLVDQSVKLIAFQIQKCGKYVNSTSLDSRAHHFQAYYEVILSLCSIAVISVTYSRKSRHDV